MIFRIESPSAPPAAGAAGPRAAGRESQSIGPVSCGLCGHRFVPDADTVACSACPMNRHCGVICCPNCGYEFVTESKLVEFFRRIFRRR